MITDNKTLQYVRVSVLHPLYGGKSLIEVKIPRQLTQIYERQDHGSSDIIPREIKPGERFERVELGRITLP